MQTFYQSGQKVRVYHGSTNSLRKQSFNKNNIVDISSFDEVIDIDPSNKIVTVEPNVPMDKLVARTLKKGFMPAVVMEFPGITVGGGIQGGAAESSAFKYGLFHDICTEYEIVLGNGDILMANKKQNSQLFNEISCTYGTLGIITKVKLKLIPATKYVKVQYTKVCSFTDARRILLDKTKQKIDFVDGIMFNAKSGVIMTGTLTNDHNLSRKSFHRFRDEWFYIHAKKVSESHETFEEIIPLKDYLFRYDRGAFWMARYLFGLLHLPFNRLSRFLASPFCTTRFYIGSCMLQTYLRGS